MNKYSSHLNSVNNTFLHPISDFSAKILRYIFIHFQFNLLLSIDQEQKIILEMLKTLEICHITLHDYLSLTLKYLAIQLKCVNQMCKQV